MWKVIAYRVVATVPTLFLIGLLSFLLLEFAPGSPASALLGDRATPDAVAELERELGLDRPLVVRFWDWCTRVLSGDLGTSALSGQPVWDLVRQRMGPTLSLAAVAFMMALAIGVPAGVAASLRPGSWIDRLATIGSSVGLAVPNFWVGILLASYVGVQWQLLPAGGYVPFAEGPLDWMKSLLLPGFALGTASAAVIARQTRSALIDALGADYVRTARAMGSRRRRIVLIDALRNAALPVLTVLGFEVARLIGGAVVIEQVFAIPGLGSLASTSVLAQDLAVVQGFVLLTGLAVVAVNLSVDVTYTVLNPKASAV